jgi:tRNA-splicing ligase RtcB
MNESTATLRVWSAEPLTAEVARSAERLRHWDDVRHVVLLPDVHLANDVCVGAVVATTHRIYPAAVGSDIGCGMATVALDTTAELLEDERRAGRLLAALYRHVPSNRHATRRDLPLELESSPLSHPTLRTLSQRDGRVQLGTLGRGNHFLEFQVDADQRLWVTVHSGSRGVGQAITRHHTRECRPGSGLVSLDAHSEAGQAYLADVDWGRRYASANRLAMLRAVEAILESEFATAVDWNTLIHSDHDHVRREVHRKGAQPAAAGEAGIIPGSMGTATYHVEGRGCPEALQSCSHGAGRELSRSDARQSIGVGALERQMQGVWFDHRRSADLRDEAPSAYKNIEPVLRAQSDLVKIRRRLTPRLCYKGR